VAVKSRIKETDMESRGGNQTKEERTTEYIYGLWGVKRLNRRIGTLWVPIWEKTERVWVWQPKGGDSLLGLFQGCEKRGSRLRRSFPSSGAPRMKPISGKGMNLEEESFAKEKGHRKEG